MDDGKRNALSPQVLSDIYTALDRAENDKAVVVLTGRDDVFSAGFDLKVMKKGGIQALRMLRLGYKLPTRVLRYPYPVVAACNGHVLAMGAFLMLSADHVIGTQGKFKISANEVAIGMTLPRVAIAVLENRLKPSSFQRAATLAHYFDVDAALDGGFFDEVVGPGELGTLAKSRARDFANLDMLAHRKTKHGVRSMLVRRLRWSAPLDLIDAAMTGLLSTRHG
jgi:enoyl-CoA hydratase